MFAGEADGYELLTEALYALDERPDEEAGPTAAWMGKDGGRILPRCACRSENCVLLALLLRLALVGGALAGPPRGVLSFPSLARGCQMCKAAPPNRLCKLICMRPIRAMRIPRAEAALTASVRIVYSAGYAKGPLCGQRFNPSSIAAAQWMASAAVIT